MLLEHRYNLNRRGRRQCTGFSLMEVMVAAAVSGIILTAVLSAFTLFSRTSLQIDRYTDMESEARLALVRFGQDARQAQNAQWTDARTVTLRVSAGDVTYRHDPDDGVFVRSLGGNERILASGVRDFEFRAYTLNGVELPIWSQYATIGGETKMIQVEFRLERTGSMTPDATYNIISARYVLRNKPTTPTSS